MRWPGFPGGMNARRPLHRVRRDQIPEYWRDGASHPKPDEVLIDVHAASVRYMDYLMVSGGYQMRPPLPYVPGTDAAGVVVAVGSQIDGFCPGDRVTCEGWYGGYAEQMTAKACRTSRLPDNVDFSVGSTVLH